MSKVSTPSFVLTRRLMTTKADQMYLDKKMHIVERIYNAGVKHCISCLRELKKDVWYQYAMAKWRTSKDEKEQAEWANEIFLAASAYGLTEYDIHEYLGKGKVCGYTKGIGINIVQKTGTALYAGVKKAVFGKKLHYRKYGSTDSFEDKKASSGIIYKYKTDSVTVMGHDIKLKPVRISDHYMQEAMTRKIKYCRITRKAFGSSYRYFVQFVMEGEAPKKIIAAKGRIGLDPGVSTMTAYNGRKLEFLELTKNVGQYTKEILHLQRVYDHKLRVNNPDCFHEDGTFIKGSRIHCTKGMLQTTMKLKAAYRKRSEYVKQSNGYDTNRLIESGNQVILEPMNYSALVKRSKKLERQEKISTIRDKQGNEKSVRKYKRRKRFVQSVLIHSPATFISTLTAKAYKYGGSVEEVNIRTYRASQYDHSNNTYEKHELSERYRNVGGFLVQRDCYSAFLLYHKKDPDHVDRASCKQDFRNFLNCQEILIASGIHNSNFGLKAA